MPVDTSKPPAIDADRHTEHICTTIAGESWKKQTHACSAANQKLQAWLTTAYRGPPRDIMIMQARQQGFSMPVGRLPSKPGHFVRHGDEAAV
jgi:hypothetical protein